MPFLTFFLEGIKKKVHKLSNLSHSIQANKPPVDLYLISEKSSWKNQVRRTGFLVYFELDFYCLCTV